MKRFKYANDNGHATNDECANAGRCRSHIALPTCTIENKSM